MSLQEYCRQEAVSRELYLATKVSRLAKVYIILIDLVTASRKYIE